MQEEQEAISRRIIRRKKSKKKKKARPATAKYVHGMYKGGVKYTRPSTAKPAKLKKKKKKTKKLSPQEMYLEQLRQQQMLQQLALEQQQLQQQQMAQQEMEDEEQEIQISPEQALLLFQQLAERQQSGEELSPEEVEQLQFLHQLLQNNMLQEQQMVNEEQHVRGYAVRKASKRRKSKNKGKKKPKKTKQVDENALLMMLQNQKVPTGPHVELPYGVDEIQEVDEEETPIRGLKGEHEGEGEEDSDHLKDSDAAVHDTDIPTQINAQVPARFGVQPQALPEPESESEEDQQAYYPQYQLQPSVGEERIPGLENVTPEQMFYLQEVNKNQMIASKLENYTDLYNPLSQSVAKAKKMYKSMKNYDLDVVDKKLHDDLICKRNGLKDFGVS